MSKSGKSALIKVIFELFGHYGVDNCNDMNKAFGRFGNFLES
jgi:phage/plasmid-associated DNA primase